MPWGLFSGFQWLFSLSKFKFHHLSCALWRSKRLAAGKGGPEEQLAMGRTWTECHWLSVGVFAAG